MVRRLDDLNGDVLYWIFEHIVARKGYVDYPNFDLRQLSATCRRMRAYCMPVLFQTCNAQPSVPPEAIRPHVRHIRYRLDFYTLDDLYRSGYLREDSDPYGVCGEPVHPTEFGLELGYLPAVRSVTFVNTPGGVPWFAIQKCLEYPNITSLAVDEGSAWMCGPPPSSVELPSCGNQLTAFSYIPSEWRETERLARGTHAQSYYLLETSYVHAIVLSMSNLAESLTLPVELAPLHRMAAMDWPRLQKLSFIGRYTHPDQSRAISALLARAPNLRFLKIQVTQCEGIRRPLLLTSPPEDSYRLRSLTLAYPNPNDPIFSYLGDGLTSLSLRDSPRHYYRERYDPRLHPATYPILSSTECLNILKRISAPRLSILELVYQADAAEDELLRYLPLAFPLLQDLELHRYRATPDEIVPYRHIARALTSVKYLRALYLNLDILECKRAGGISWQGGVDDNPWERARHERGLELVREVLRDSECFETLALLLHTAYGGEYTFYHPPWYPGGEVQLNGPYSVDSVALDLFWL